ncbi:NEDD8 ultimate buster 1-like [Ruditapes philippinarum]|uniref:NEDD8 ultimate buster 1-like n=1 Tax=Ruditapes philippinarum TaxID=129788 RepID=UPI00295AEB59|nr:NEDD8 ultimate buster 1-like [Ruditapes philippinarum]XP_060601703.1 NEDD8 ultimate buster 1-like [Ruditapes philippinarum]
MASDDFYKKMIGKGLNRDKIKLWELPYTNKDGSAGSIPQEIISKYAKEFSIQESQVSAILETLRTHALQKLAEIEKFKSSGLATLKIKISGIEGHKEIIPVEVNLSCNGEELRKKISELLVDSNKHFKLICSGRVIADDKVLQEQNIKNGSQILVLCLKVTECEAKADDKISAEIQDFRHAAELLSRRAEQEHDEMDIQIADQSGKPIQLPPGEKRALTLAMALHEKGRQALKKKNVTLALPLLLEADKEFKQCRADILNSVDNYAILCLDIVWCYLCLKQVEDLPDAEERLRSSENFFEKSYGSDLQRLMAVKDSSGEELALFMKLHLLQGIVAFHQHRMQDASNLLTKAEQELQRLDIDDDKITTVMSMGFMEGETRLGLRACSGNVENAVAHIMKRREEKKENARKRRKERQKKNLVKHLGQTADGNNVNVDVYEMLLGMGYPKGASAEALRQANNDLNLALEVLQNHPEFLSLPDPEPKPNVPITDGMIAQVTSMGFEPDMAQRALLKHKGDVAKAIEELVSCGGNISSPESADQSPSTSSGASGSNPSDEEMSNMKTPEQLREEREAIDRLVSDLPEDEEDYLDINLEEEKQFLKEYKSLLISLNV